MADAGFGGVFEGAGEGACGGAAVFDGGEHGSVVVGFVCGARGWWACGVDIVCAGGGVGAGGACAAAVGVAGDGEDVSEVEVVTKPVCEWKIDRAADYPRS